MTTRTRPKRAQPVPREQRPKTPPDFELTAYPLGISREMQDYLDSGGSINGYADRIADIKRTENGDDRE